MESPDSVYTQLDQAFDKQLAEMKPHVLKLPHKSDRQKCAVWIKKLCEPATGITGRKNRNMYAQLMVHMLKRGVLEGPFTSKPRDGPLETLPPYMSIYFDEPATGADGGKEDDKVPDWVAGELTSSVGSSLFRPSGVGNPAATSTWRTSPLAADRRRPHTSLGFDLDKEPRLSSPSHDILDRGDKGLFSMDDMGVGVRKNPRTALNFLSDDEDSSIIKGSKEDPRRIGARSPGRRREPEVTDMDWSRPSAHLTNTTDFLRGSTFLDDPSIPKGLGARELELKSKMLQAKFHEEKLRLQQKHDAAVQKILDRKNAEIEEVKSNYRTKAKELEDTVSKLDKKVHTLVKEGELMRETKDKQITELKKMAEQSDESRQNEYEKKINDLVSEFEQDKFEMQKQHTTNIQEILDDTNARLQKMEKEYSAQTTSTNNIIKELESRVQQLMRDADTTSKTKTSLEKSKIDLESRLEKVNSELQDIKTRYGQLEREHQKTLEVHSQEIRTLKNKCEASVEFLKQESNIASAKASDSVTELEQHVDTLKRSLKDAEEQRQRQIRELEQVHQQDKLHQENLHDKEIRSLKKEMEQLDNEYQKKIKKLEQTVKDKEDEAKKLEEKVQQQAQVADKALQEFKSQVEKNQSKMYDDMKQQMEKVEADLNKSKQVREKQAKEFTKLIEDERSRHEREMTELRLSFEQEKAHVLKDIHLQRELTHSEYEKELENSRDIHKLEVTELKTRMQDRQERDAKKISGLERQVQDLREEVVQANQLRKQQLVELGLLREEEKQKMNRESEAETSKLRSEMEQQRLELQKTHSTELEKMLEKTNERLKDIEREYTERAQKSSETCSELQATIHHLREEIKRVKNSGDKKMSEIALRHDGEKKAVKKQYGSSIQTMQQELESQKARVRNLERQIEIQNTDHEEKSTHLKLAYEEKIRGLMPAAVRQELEDTIASLKSQVNSLQQKSLILQEEMDLQDNYPSLASQQTTSAFKSSV